MSLAALARRGGTNTLAAALRRQAAAARAYSAAAARGEVIEVSDDAALQKAIESSSASVVNYTAVWCGPCRAMAAPLAALAKKHEGVAFLKVDIDSPALASSVAAAGVTAVPTYVVRKGAQVLETIQGARLELLQKAVEQAAGAK